MGFRTFSDSVDPTRKYVDTIYVELDDGSAQKIAEAKPIAEAAISAATDAFNKLDGTGDMWTAYTTADEDADEAITAYETVGGKAEGLAGYTDFTANVKVAEETLPAEKTKFDDTNYSAASTGHSTAAVNNLDTLKIRIICADDGIIDDTARCVVKVVVKQTAKTNDESVTVTATFIDGTTADATITTASLASEITSGAEVYGSI